MKLSKSGIARLRLLSKTLDEAALAADQGINIRSEHFYNLIDNAETTISDLKDEIIYSTPIGERLE